MAGIKMAVTGDLSAMLKMYGKEVTTAVSEAVTVTALDVQGDAKKRIQRGPKSGRVYIKSRSGTVVTHQASAPGESPASDTGQLANSITYQKLRPLVAEVGTINDYGRWLEFGTMRIAERPWLRPAIDINRAEFLKRIKTALNRAKR